MATEWTVLWAGYSTHHRLHDVIDMLVTVVDDLRFMQPRKSSHAETAAVQMQCVEASLCDAQQEAWPHALPHYKTEGYRDLDILQRSGPADAANSHVSCGVTNCQLKMSKSMFWLREGLSLGYQSAFQQWHSRFGKNKCAQKPSQRLQHPACGTS